MVKNLQDHGGGVDAAADQFGGTRGDWIDLSTGINPVAYPIGQVSDDAWTSLPDKAAQSDLVRAARNFWHVPASAAVLATPGASAPIAMIPQLHKPGNVAIATPTYNEHAAAFSASGWTMSNVAPDAQVIVHPNNPDGRTFNAQDLHAPLRIIDESFCDVMPAASLVEQTTQPNTLVLKSFGKFWGLAGLRLGFVIGAPEMIERLAQMLGPWPVAGPALAIGTRALEDTHWAAQTRERLTKDAQRLDALMATANTSLIGGTSLFRLYEVDNADDWQTHLAHHHIWSRTFPYNPRWLRLGLPAPHQWSRLEGALK